MSKFIDELKNEIKRPSFLAFAISAILFAFVWQFTDKEINTFKTLTTILVTITYTIYYAIQLSKTKPPLYDKLINCLIIVMLVYFSIALIAIPNNEVFLAQFSFISGFFSIIIIAFLLTFVNIYRAMKKIINEKMPLWALTLSYIVTVLSVIILFGLVFGFANNYDNQSLQKDVGDKIIVFSDYYYFSFQVFYTTGFGEFHPSNILVQFFVVIETLFSFVLHILLLGNYFGNSNGSGKNAK